MRRDSAIEASHIQHILLEAASGFEPLNRGFADPRLNHLATSPSITVERKMGFEHTTFSLARRRSTTELLPPFLHPVVNLLPGAYPGLHR